MTKHAIEINNLYKTYYLNPKFKQNFRDKIQDFFKPSKSLPNKVKVDALKGIDIKIRKGEVVGIIGDNGSGKSTLLKIIGGITQQSSGDVFISGRLASILEIGTGFHPELTGRENIYFSAGVLGLKRSEVKLIEDSIIEFSELGDFINVQTKYYSSGMFMRLAFSVVSHINADIILLDEVFSVGDAGFREKSEKKILELKNNKKTILFVSHEIGSVARLCTSFLQMENGHISRYGNDMEVLAKYLNNDNAKEKKEKEEHRESISLERKHQKKYKTSVGKKGEITTLIDDFDSDFIESNIEVSCYSESEFDNMKANEKMFIKLSFNKKNEGLVFPCVSLSYQFGDRFAAITPMYSFDESNRLEFFKSGNIVCTCELPPFIFNKGFFNLNLYFTDQSLKPILLFENVLTFKISFKKGFAQKNFFDERFTGPLLCKLKWSLGEKFD